MYIRYIVSSPQGNATNFPHDAIVTASLREFQVPKGMLQTKRSSKVFLFLEEVSSPQGNATNTLSKSRETCKSISVSSPQGNATNIKNAKDLINAIGQFQVPKGMLQTLQLDCVASLSSVFQVPKGMLQTPKRIAKPLAMGLSVSSPQGNATNQFSGFRPFRTFVCFKSPRECYKRKEEPIYTECKKLFQVPKGMLQTVLSEVIDTDSLFGFKSPRECYKRE